MRACVWSVEGCLGANACHGHVIISGNTFSRLAPIGLQIAKQSRSYFLRAVLWRQTYVVDICGGRICGLQCLAIALQHGGGWGRMGISQLRYQYCSPPFCARVGDGWEYRSSVLRNCDIGIAAAIPISQFRVLCVYAVRAISKLLPLACRYDRRRAAVKLRQPLFIMHVLDPM